METTHSGDALLIVDVQNDFCPGGALPVREGDAVVPLINRISKLFSVVGATQDWHPLGHMSFASTYPGKKPYDTVPWQGTEQVLWPDHCVQGTFGADFHPDLDTRALRFVVRKGWRPSIDSYSGFLENDHRTPTGLAGLLRELGVMRVFIAGLTTDYCVRTTAVDGLDAGFRVTVLLDACRGVDVPAGNVKSALEELRSKGAAVLVSSDLRAA
ncbi:MAG: bifunctional nicotinamidase/pyrazinamidase [bacterium]